MADVKSGAVLYTRVPVNALTQLVLPQVALIVLVAIRLPYAQKVALSIILLGSLLHTTFTVTTGDVANNYMIGCVILADTFCNTIYCVWFTDPMEQFRYLSDSSSEPLASRSFLSRLYNATCIIRNNRLVGWNVQVANVPSPFKGTRTQFFLHRFRQILFSFFLADFADSYVHPFRHYYLPGGSPPGIFGFIVQSWGIAMWIVMSYVFMKLQYEVASVFAVGIGYSRPQDWPDLFGNWLEVYTVRRVWSHGWHQILGRHFSSWGKLMIRVFGVQRGTWQSSLVKLWTAFLLSGLIHSFGDIMIGRQHFGRCFPFFLLNAVAIMVEDVVIRLGKSCGVGRYGSTRALKLLGYVWVVSFIRYAGPVHVGWAFESGLGENRAIPFSPIRDVAIPWFRRALGSVSFS